MLSLETPRRVVQVAEKSLNRKSDHDEVRKVVQKMRVVLVLSGLQTLAYGVWFDQCLSKDTF